MSNSHTTSKPEDELRKKVNDRFGLNVAVPSTFDERIKYCNDFADEIEAHYAQQQLEEAKRYCDDGHYHDERRDLAMLPSERLAELSQPNKLKEEQ